MLFTETSSVGKISVLLLGETKAQGINPLAQRLRTERGRTTTAGPEVRVGTLGAGLPASLHRTRDPTPKPLGLPIQVYLH